MKLQYIDSLGMVNNLQQVDTFRQTWMDRYPVFSSGKQARHKEDFPAHHIVSDNFGGGKTLSINDDVNFI